MFALNENRIFPYPDTGAPLGGIQSGRDVIYDSPPAKIARDGVAILLPDETYDNLPEWRGALGEIRDLAATLNYNPIRSAYAPGVFYSRVYLQSPADWSNPWRDTIASGPGADRLRELLTGEEIGKQFNRIFGAELTLLLCRINRMGATDFIGPHTHPKKEINFVLTVQEADLGGEYSCVLNDRSTLREKFPAGTLVVNQGRPEEVARVEAGERYSIVWLLEKK